MSKIRKAVANAKQMIEAKIESGEISKDQAEAMRGQLDMGLEEYAMFQELKSLARSHRTISLEDAQLVYGYLGETPNTYNKQSLAVKITLMNLFKELMVWRTTLSAA
jgi:hypothetical protein